MKRVAIGAICFVVFCFFQATYADEADILSYTIYRFVTYDQSGVTTPSLDSVGTGIIVNETSPGSVAATPTIQLPDATVHSLNDFGNYWSTGSSFGSIAAMDAAWTMGSYLITIPTTSGAATIYTPSLNMLPTVTAIPTIGNTTWSGGNLALDFSVDNTITWNVNDGDDYNLHMSGSLGDDISLSGDASDLSVFIPAGTLDPAQIYNSNILFEHDSSDWAQVPGVEGRVLSYAQTYFTIVNIPEPSIGLMVFIALGLFGVLAQYKRKQPSLK